MTGAARPELEPDLYARLGVGRAATARELAAAYRRAARRHHPDHGGSADAFAAVEEAYRVLRAVDTRAAYDAEAEGAADEWDDLGWGVPADPPTPPGASADDGPAPGAVDPFRARAWALPPTPTLAELQSSMGRAAERRRARVALAATVVTAVLALAATAVQPDAGQAIGVLVLVVGGLDSLAGASVLQRAHEGRGGLGLFVTALAASGLMLVVCVAAVIVGPSLGVLVRVLGGLVGLSAAVVLVYGAGWVFLVRRRRAGDDGATEALHRLQTRRLLADEWNLVREALRVPGARVGLVLERVDALWRDNGVLVWDVRARARVVLLLTAPLEPGTWVVHDPSGAVLAVAEHDCLAAWCDLLDVRVPELDLWTVELRRPPAPAR